jgi:chaperone modulatory protein CbpM
MIQLIISEANPELNTEELCHCANISETLLYELVEHSIAVPIVGRSSHEWVFSITTVNTVKKATRIYRDLAIDWPGIALVLSLLDDIENLKADNEKLKKQLSRFMAN